MEINSDQPTPYAPVVLQSDLFTPLQRTPWAGSKIVEKYKPTLSQYAGQKVGESWEFSCDPTFPSRIERTSETLSAIIEQDPVSYLSPRLSHLETSQILIKILDAQEPLSLQVHPSDTDPCLEEHECGKPESWYILDAEPGAGLYLGFREKYTKQQIADAITRGDCASLFQFVEVQPGDYFDIAPGVPHAIGPGVTLLEPQRLLPGKSGKTCRFWDWDRRYNSKGEPDANGQPRELHVEASLRLVNSERDQGEEFIKRVRKHPHFQKIGTSQVLTWPATDDYQFHKLEVRHPLQYSINEGYGILTITEGQITICSTDKSQTTLQKGQTCMLPWACFPLSLSGEGIAMLVTPPNSSNSFF